MMAGPGALSPSDGGGRQGGCVHWVKAVGQASKQAGSPDALHKEHRPSRQEGSPGRPHQDVGTNRHAGHVCEGGGPGRPGSQACCLLRRWATDR